MKSLAGITTALLFGWSIWLLTRASLGFPSTGTFDSHVWFMHVAAIASLIASDLVLLPKHRPRPGRVDTSILKLYLTRRMYASLWAALCVALTTCALAIVRLQQAKTEVEQYGLVIFASIWALAFFKSTVLFLFARHPSPNAEIG